MPALGCDFRRVCENLSRTRSLTDATTVVRHLLTPHCKYFKGHSDSVHCLAFSEDGKYLASGADDYNVILWDINQGRALKTLVGHTDVVHALSFCGGNNLLASGGADNTIRTWDVMTAALQDSSAPMESSEWEESPELCATFFTKSTPVLATQFSRTNLLVAAGVFSPEA
eukprot:m.120399 g.120399  ORF g.120399 m.120399 type:complete len:170 (+) comp9576_c0_seq4:1467-1976(+)